MAEKNMRLGEILVDFNYITPEQFEKALEQQKESNKRLGDILVELGYLSEEELLQALEFQLGVPRADLDEYHVNPELAGYLPENLARRHNAVPLKKEDNILRVAVADPTDLVAIDDIAMSSDLEIEVMIASQQEIKMALTEIYGHDELDIDEIFGDLKLMDDPEEMEEEGLRELGEEAPIIRLANQIIIGAHYQNASDIHLEALEDRVRIRYRIDGVLHDELSAPRSSLPALVSRFKIMADLDITETRIPQDGRIKMRVEEDEEIDMRVSTLPTVGGEKVVIRLLSRDDRLLNLENLGFSRENLNKFYSLIEKPHGILLVTGPTGSGKSTTLFAALNHLNTVEDNIVTIEDPVEYQLEGINQVQANPKTGLTFANTLRSILRQDPDIIMVGEMRDEETVEIAVRAALTGHLVLSTLHTNDAVSSVTRLIDMQVPPYLVASAVIGVMAQRLVRRLCPDCKEQYDPEPGEHVFLGDYEPKHIYRAGGCYRCSNTGYRGRLAVQELLLFNEEIKRLVSKGAEEQKLQESARRQGMNTLKEDGIEKLETGLTDLEELKQIIF